MYGNLLNPEMRTYPLRVQRDLGVVPRGNSRRTLARWAPANHQSPGGVWVSTPCRAHRPGGSELSSPCCWSCRDMEIFIIRGWEPILPGCGGTSALSRGATLAARWLDGPQPISNHPVGLGFPHPARRYRPGGSAFSSLGCWSCRDVKGFLIQRWELILPRCGGTSALSRGATLAARRLHEPQPISNHTVRLEFPHPAGRYRPGRYVFSSPGCWSCRYIEGFLLRGWELILPGVRWLYVRSPANLRWASGTGVSTSCGLFRPGGPSFFVPRLSEL